MFITAALCVGVVLGLFRATRDGSGAMYALLMGLGAWGLDSLYPHAAPFRPSTAVAILLLHVAVATLVTFFLYGYDKNAARRGAYRVREKTLHAFTFLGGTFGAWAGQRVFRHKTKKRSFRGQYAAIVLIQITVLIVLAYMWAIGMITLPVSSL